MPTARRDVFERLSSPVIVRHCAVGAAHREETEAFIRTIFARHHAARVVSFAPQLLRIERHERIVAAAGWRPAATQALFLERYLDQPVEKAMARLAERRVPRERLVEVANLAAEKPGATVHVVRALAAHLDRLGYEWVVFTATRELIGILGRLGLRVLALAPADPARLGDAAGAWGHYYEQQPIVVAGRIRLALERIDPRR